MSSKTHHLFLAMCPNPEATLDVASLRSCNDTQSPQDPKKVVVNFCSVHILFVTIEENAAFKKENHCALPQRHSGITEAYFFTLCCFTT